MEAALPEGKLDELLSASASGLAAAVLTLRRPARVQVLRNADDLV